MRSRFQLLGKASIRHPSIVRTFSTEKPNCSLQGVPTQSQIPTDWQTITTECRKPVREIELNFAKESGSSLADMTVGSEDDIPPGRHMTGNKTSENYGTHEDVGLGKLIRQGKPDEPLLKTANKTSDPPRASKFPQLPARAAGAIRHLSNPFCQDHATPTRAKPTAMYELKDFCSSYESLDSEPVQLRPPSHQSRRGISGRSPIRQDFGWDPPNLTISTLDEQQSGWNNRQLHVNGNDGPALQERFPSGVPSLPFPLVSLPEAAMLQYFRRERGEEDHTDPASSFAAKARSARSGTVSTLSSLVGPATPLSAFGDMPTGNPAAATARPSAAYQSRRLPRQLNCMWPFAHV